LAASGGARVEEAAAAEWAWVAAAGWVAAVARGARAWRSNRRPPWRRRSMQPKIALAVPGSSSVVPTPVVPYAEYLDTEAKPRTVLDDRHATVLIIVVKIVGINPAAISLPVNIAPGPIVHTAIEGYKRVGRYARYQRIVTTGPRAKMDYPVRVSTRSKRH
jgi:hypothetical protein